MALRFLEGFGLNADQRRLSAYCVEFIYSWSPDVREARSLSAFHVKGYVSRL